MEFKLGQLDHPQVIGLLTDHLADMVQQSPEESRHALDLSGLQQPDVTFWGLWEGADLAGCVALKHLGSDHGELKSMRVVDAYRGQGLGQRMLAHVVQVAKDRGYARLSLETGSMAFFAPARRLYRAYGFNDCPPFGDYVPDPNSVFMTLPLLT